MEKGFLRTLTVGIIISVCLSVGMAALIVRACLGTGFKFDLSPASFICGKSDIGTEMTTFRRLAPNEMSVISNTPERSDLSIGQGRGAEKLIDGSEETLAAPGSNTIDYTVTLLDSYEIKQIIIRWGDYGVNTNYIRSWSLESSDNGSAWKVLASGPSPADVKTVINDRMQTSHLRLKAQAEKDWIGAYELEVVGKPIP